jgi:choline-sulfatase
MNFLLIQTDQQRRDCLGLYGNETVKTPAADMIGRQGVVFDYAFTTTPICGASRASLITGKYPNHHGILFNHESGSIVGCDFLNREDTLAEILGRNGYRSTLCGKWHVGKQTSPGDCGFEGVFYPGYGYPSEHPHYLEYLKKLGCRFSLSDEVFSRCPDGTSGPLLSAVQEGPEEASVPHYLANQAIEAMRAAVKDGRPFLVRCDFWGPHVPYIIPERYAKMYDPDSIQPWSNFEDDLSDKPAIQKIMRHYWGVQDFTWKEWSRMLAFCYGYSTLIDDQVARMLAALDELGLADNTAVLYTSDHGGMVGAHGLADKGPYLYDEVCRVPLMLRVPGIKGGRRSDTLCYNMDLMPTILDLAGCSLPESIDACSLLPVLSGGTETVRENQTAFIEFHGHQVPYAQRLLRNRTSKYIFNVSQEDEFYDLSSDPGELINRVGDPDYALLLTSMRAEMLLKLEEMGDPLLRFFKQHRLCGC